MLGLSDVNDKDIEMSHEVTHLYRNIFKDLPSSLLVSRYVLAHRCIQELRETENRTLSIVIKKKLDAEAIEFFLRNRNHLITKKMTLISYLAELEVKNYSIFIGDEKRFLYGLFRLVGIVLGSIFKYLKGSFLVWRYHLV